MSSLFFRSLFVLSLVTTLSTPLFAQESVEEVDASPVVFTNDTLSVLEGNTAFVRLTADDIQETTRVRVRITPDTARSGTDYRNPGVVTVTFYKNGVNNKRIGVRTINRSGVQGERSFTASIISINGKAVPADTGEMMEVTIVDRGVRTTTTGTTSTVGVTANAKPVVGNAPALSVTSTTVTTPRCTPGASIARFSVEPARAGLRDYLMYNVGQSYHMPFSVPARWWEKIPRAPNTNFGPNGELVYRMTGNLHTLFVQDVMGPYMSDYPPGGGGGLDMDFSISECPGDFNPQTACVIKGSAVSIIPFYEPNSNKDTYMKKLGLNTDQGCALQGGKQYYLNARVNKCGGATTCSNETQAANAPSRFYPPNWHTKERCQTMSTLTDVNSHPWCLAWGHITQAEYDRLQQNIREYQTCRNGAGYEVVTNPTVCDYALNRSWRDNR